MRYPYHVVQVQAWKSAAMRSLRSLRKRTFGFVDIVGLSSQKDCFNGLNQM
jgi:hypothetical protein